MTWLSVASMADPIGWHNRFAQNRRSAYLGA
jgi:hypothetical protein